MSKVTTCWSCKGPLSSAGLFCPTCGAVSAIIESNPFTLFGLPTGFDVDLKALEHRYFSLSRQLHPDRFATKGPQTMMLALQHTASLNDAYATLKDDLNRAIYMLRAQGVTAFDEAGQGKTPPALMATSFELHEQLEDATTPQALQSLLTHVKKQRTACLKNLSDAFAKYDTEAATQATLELKFLTGFEREWHRKNKRIKDSA